MERANQVLPSRVVNRSLPTHARINLREKGRGYLHEGYSSQVDRGSKPGDIADYASPEGNHT